MLLSIIFAICGTTAVVGQEIGIEVEPPIETMPPITVEQTQIDIHNIDTTIDNVPTLNENHELRATAQSLRQRAAALSRTPSAAAIQQAANLHQQAANLHQQAANLHREAANLSRGASTVSQQSSIKPVPPLNPPVGPPPVDKNPPNPAPLNPNSSPPPNSSNPLLPPNHQPSNPVVPFPTETPPAAPTDMLTGYPAPPLPVLGFDQTDFPHVNSCANPAGDSVTAESSNSSTTRSAIRVIDEVAGHMIPAGVGVLSDDIPELKGLSIVYQIAMTANKSVFYGVQATTNNVDARLFDLTEQSSELQRLIADGDQAAPPGSPEFDQFRRASVTSLMNQIREEQAAVPPFEKWQAFTHWAMTSTPEIEMHEVDLVAQGVSEALLGKFADEMLNPTNSPEEILPAGTLQRLDTLFSRNAWRDFHLRKAAVAYLRKLSADGISETAVSTISDGENRLLNLYQDRHPDCIDSTLVVFATAPVLQARPIEKVVFAPAVVENAPAVQVVVATPIGQLQGQVRQSIAAVHQTLSEAEQTLVTGHPPIQSQPAEQQNAVLRRSAGDQGDSLQARNCEYSGSCRQAIQMSAGPTIAGHIFDGQLP